MVPFEHEHMSSESEDTFSHREVVTSEIRLYALEPKGKGKEEMAVL